MKTGTDYLRYWVVIAFLVFQILLTTLGLSPVYAQDDEHDETCNVTELTTHWAEHAVDLSRFAQTAQEDLDAALRDLYIAGIAYQALALQCGFDAVIEAEREHAAEHGLEVVETEHAMEDELDADTMAFVMSIGDPENGQVLFNTLQPQTGFACATCHYVDSAERLVGPGLLGIGNPEHDPSEHSEGDMEGMDMAGMNDEHADEDGHAEGEETDEHTDEGDEDHAPASGMNSMDMVVEYIRTSILEPSMFVVEGFPDNLMPATYREVFTEEEINDLIAYLLTLR